MLKRLSNWFLVRPGEGRTLLYLSCVFLAVGMGMAVGRSSSDALFFKRVGVEYLPQMFFLTSLLLVFFGSLYAEFADRIASARLFQFVVGILGVLLLAVWYVMQVSDTPAAFTVYFLAYGVASEILLVQLGVYASSFLNATQAKRLLPILNASGRFGAVFGGVTLGIISAHISLEHSSLLWAISLAGVFGFIGLRHRGRHMSRPRDAAKRKRFLHNLREGVHFARSSALLQVTGVTLFIMVILMSMQDYIASTILTRHFQDERDLAAFLGWFLAFTNVLVLLLQLLVTNRLLRRFGLKAVSLIFPWSMAFTFGLLSFSASLIPAVLARFNYTGMLPAFRNPSAQLFYHAVPDYMHGRAFALNVGLILPLGLIASALILMLVPKHAVGEILALGGLGLSLVYIYLKIRKNRIYSDELIQLIRKRVFVAGGAMPVTGRLDDKVIREIDSALAKDPAPEIFLSMANFLIESVPSEAGNILIKHLPKQVARVQDQLLPRLAELAPDQAGEHARSCLGHEDVHLRATGLRVLGLVDRDGALKLAQEWLGDVSSRLRGEAACLLLQEAEESQKDLARSVLKALWLDGAVDARIAALRAVQRLGLVEFAPEVIKALAQEAPVVRVEAMKAAGHLLAAGCDDCSDWVIRGMDDSSPVVREASMDAASKLPEVGQRLAMLEHGLRDSDPKIRRFAKEQAERFMPTTIPEFSEMAHRYAANFQMQSLLARGMARSKLQGWDEELNAMCKRHLQSAWQKKSVLAVFTEQNVTIAGEDPPSIFLLTVLAEDVDRHVDLALEALGCLDSSGAVEIARAGLASRDPRFRAKAVEAVHNLQNVEVAALLLPLLEARHDGALWRRQRAELPQSFEELLAWCKTHGSEWLSGVALNLEKGSHAGAV